MAIGPNILSETFMKEVDHFEQKLDQLLSGKKLSPNSSVNVDVPSDMSYSHFQVLKERYIKAGWGNVTWNTDQREGEWMVFDTKKPNVSGDWRDR